MTLSGRGRGTSPAAVLGVMKNTTADSPDHRAVANHQHLERDLVTAGDEAIQELTIGESAQGPHPEKRSQIADGRSVLDGIHRVAFSIVTTVLYLSFTRPGRFS